MIIKKTLIGSMLLLLLFCLNYDQVSNASGLIRTDLVIGQSEENAPSDAISSKYGFNLVQELILGRTVAYGLLERFNNKVVTDPSLNRYVNLVGQSVAKVSSKRPNINYKFGIIDNSEINAFACPGGYIFITTGTLKVLKNENELAAILAHEIGHVEHGDGLRDIRTHKADEYAQLDVENLEKDLGAVNDIATSLPYAGWYTSYYSPKNLAKRGLGQLIGNIGGGYGGYVASSAAGAVSDAAIDSASQGLKKLAKLIAQKSIKRWYYDPLDPSIELEADKFSVESVAKAGYDPKGLENFLELIRLIEVNMASEGQQTGSQNVFTYRHPSTETRINQVEEIISSPGFEVKNPNAANNATLKSRYKQNIAVLKKK